MEDDQRLNTLVHEGDALRFSVYHCKKPENRCIAVLRLRHCNDVLCEQSNREISFPVHCTLPKWIGPLLRNVVSMRQTEMNQC